MIFAASCMIRSPFDVSGWRELFFVSCSVSVFVDAGCCDGVVRVADDVHVAAVEEVERFGDQLHAGAAEDVMSCVTRGSTRSARQPDELRAKPGRYRCARCRRC